MKQHFACVALVTVLMAYIVPAIGQATNTTPGPSQSQPGSVSASGPAPAAGPIPAPGVPPPQPAGYPQVSMPYDIRNPSASDDLPIAGPLAPRPVNQPEQIHLAYGGSTPGTYGGQQSMYVSWNTGPVQQRLGAVTLPNVSCTPSIVKYGLTSTALTQTATGSATAYTQLYVPQFGFEQNYSSASIHHVKVQGLIPNTLYYYTVGDGTPANTSPVLSFTSAPLPGTAPFRLVLFADLGQSENSSSTLEHMQESLATDPVNGAAAHLLYIADYSYADTYQSNGTDTALIPSSVRHQNFQAYQPRDDSFGRFVEPLTQQYPFMGCQGNHEIHLQGDNVTNFQSWLHRWVFPWRESASPSPFFYSYDYGAAHIISLSNYVWPNYKYDSPQYQWLQKDLQSVNRTLTPWVIVHFHNPWYSTYSYSDFKQQDCFRQILEPLMYKYGVDLVYNGHVHSYERFYPVNDWQINQCGYTSIVIGDGGNQEGLTINYVDKPGNCMAVSNGAYYFQDICKNDAAGYGGAIFAGGNVSGFCPPANFQPSPSAYREPSFGHGTLDILNATHAYWQWHRNQDGDRVTADSTPVWKQMISLRPR
ncbi:hypothetical protein WJX84_010024 [Apatococcus fuscideae]|uniref:Purple acid phosphatase n=1 Tax=Apatococcus fuscideae TaxID=2026836 RepID=A0AAW1SU66_9CHLO